MPRALIVEIFANAKQFYGELDRAAGKTRMMGKAAGVAGLAIAGGLAYGMEKSVKAAMDFQSSMELVHTQAGVTQKGVEQLKQGVLQLAGPTATAPEELSKGIYHLASQGLRGAKSMEALKIAAEGAKVGQADLEDVTNALGATLVSGIRGAKNMSSAMGMLNATVGAGDMRMQDLADAMGTGVLAMGKMAGVGLKDVNAALAVFGDNNIRGAKAGTLVASALRLMSSPSAAAAKALGDAGINSEKLANTLRDKGLVPALTSLQKQMDAAGMSATEQGTLIGRAFGGRQATGIRILMSQMDRLKMKEEEVGHGASGFGEAWKATSETTKFKFEQMKTAMEAVSIALGTALIPAVTAVAEKLAAFTGFLERHTVVAKILVVTLGLLAAAMIAVSVATAIASAATAVFAAVMFVAASPILLVVAALAVLGIAIYEIVHHWGAISAFFAGVWDRVKAVFLAGINFVMSHWRAFAVGLATVIAGPLGFLVAYIATHWNQIKGMAAAAWAAITGVVRGAWNAIKGAVASGVSAVLAIVKSLPGKIVAALGNLGHLLYSAGLDLMKGLANGIVAGAKDVYDKAKGVADKAKSVVESALHIHSPSGVFHEIGLQMMAGLENGIAKGAAQLNLGGMTGGIVAAATPGTRGTPASGAVVTPIHVTVNGWVGNDHALANKIRNELVNLGRREPNIFGGYA